MLILCAIFFKSITFSASGKWKYWMRSILSFCPFSFSFTSSVNEAPSVVGGAYKRSLGWGHHALVGINTWWCSNQIIPWLMRAWPMTDAWPSSVLPKHICRAARDSDTFVGRSAKPSWLNVLATNIESVQTMWEIKGGGREGNTLRRSAPLPWRCWWGLWMQLCQKLFFHDVMPQAPSPISILLNPVGLGFYCLPRKEP